jgi:hypothetical protein
MTLRTLKVTLDRGSWNGKPIPKALSALAATGSIIVDVRDALLTIAWITWPPEFVGCTLAEHWAWLRYVPALDAGPLLRLRAEWTNIDAHQKTVMSDDFGVGFAASILCDVLDFVEYADTVWALRNAYAGSTKLGRVKKRGRQKSPDYLAVDMNGRISFLECKGSQTRHSELIKAVRNGIRQKRNVKAAGKTKIRHALATGVFVPQANSKEGPLFHVVDPEREDIDDALREVGSESLVRAIRQVSFGKQLATAGFLQTAAVLIQNPEPSAPQIRSAAEHDSRYLETTPSEDVRLVTQWRLPIAEMPQVPQTSPARRMRFTATVPGELVQTLREGTVITQSGRSEGGQKWSRESNDNGRTLVAPSGIRFSLYGIE